MRYVLINFPQSEACGALIKLITAVGKEDTVEILEFTEDSKAPDLLRKHYDTLIPGVVFDLEEQKPVQGEELATLLGVKLVK